MNYEMGGAILSKTMKEKDLGVSMNADMKVSEQCRIATSKGNQVLGMIRRNIKYKEKSLIVPLYKAIVRPHLEYCIQAWILNGYENIDSNIFFEIKESKTTRGHNFTLVKKQSRLDVRKFSFSQRTINVWNKL